MNVESGTDTARAPETAGRSRRATRRGFPNGRRPNDDVTDIALRVVGGANYIAGLVGDGVNFLGGAPGAGTNDGPGYGAIPATVST